MILLLGATGYVGQAFVKELQRRELPFYSISRKEVDYTNFQSILDHLKESRPGFVINAAGFTGRPNVDACETYRAETLLGNTLFPTSLAQACLVAKIPWGHVSSGCIYNGAKISQAGQMRIETDLSKAEIRRMALENRDQIHGFSEKDRPNFSFRSPPCSFYSGTKALAEEAMADVGEGYLWRLRIPFDEFDNPRNYLTKVQSYAKVYDNLNSLSHRADFVSACIDLWEKRAPFGIYNITNPGFVATRQVIELIKKTLKTGQEFTFWENDEAFYKYAKAPRSNCIMDVSKLLAAGVKMRPVSEALDDALRNWTRRVSVPPDLASNPGSRIDVVVNA
jgi:dTDP-4-dehydrorhamnose reductase